jgi:hypothetical protein
LVIAIVRSSSRGAARFNGVQRWRRRANVRREVTSPARALKLQKGMDQITPGMTYGLTALTLAVYSIPLLFVVWRLTKTSIRVRTRDLVFLGMIGFLFLMPWIDALIPDNLILALALIMSGVAK